MVRASLQRARRLRQIGSRVTTPSKKAFWLRGAGWGACWSMAAGRHPFPKSPPNSPKSPLNRIWARSSGTIGRTARRHSRTASCMRVSRATNLRCISRTACFTAVASRLTQPIRIPASPFRIARGGRGRLIRTVMAPAPRNGRF